MKYRKPPLDEILLEYGFPYEISGDTATLLCLEYYYDNFDLCEQVEFYLKDREIPFEYQYRKDIPPPTVNFDYVSYSFHIDDIFEHAPRIYWEFRSINNN